MIVTNPSPNAHIGCIEDLRLLFVSLVRSVEGLAGYAQQDAHEFFIAAINGMHTASHGPDDAKARGANRVRRDDPAGLVLGYG